MPFVSDTDSPLRSGRGYESFVVCLKGSDTDSPPHSAGMIEFSLLDQSVHHTTNASKPTANPVIAKSTNRAVSRTLRSKKAAGGVFAAAFCNTCNASFAFVQVALMRACPSVVMISRKSVLYPVL